MRVEVAQRRSTPQAWPTSSILGSTSRRLGMALLAIGVLWAGVIWAILTQPRDAELVSASPAKVADHVQTLTSNAPAPEPQRVGGRALAMTGQPIGVNGSLHRFRPDVAPL